MVHNSIYRFQYLMYIYRKIISREEPFQKRYDDMLLQKKGGVGVLVGQYPSDVLQQICRCTVIASNWRIYPSC